MEAFHELRASKCRERDIHVYWKEMHIHMSETELKEKKKEKMLNNVKNLSKSRRKNWWCEENN
jgi:hypothetical protein